MHEKNSNLVIADKDLQKQTSQVIIQTIVPVYRSYMRNYGPLIEQDRNASKYSKYTAQFLEKMLGSLFHHKPMKHGLSKMRLLSGKLNLWISIQYKLHIKQLNDRVSVWLCAKFSTFISTIENISLHQRLQLLATIYRKMYRLSTSLWDVDAYDILIIPLVCFQELCQAPDMIPTTWSLYQCFFHSNSMVLWYYV